MNERKPSWVCPVCDQKAYYDDLFQDGLFTKIIADAGNYDDIVFFEDGSWRPLEDIQMGQEGARPLAESLPPKPSTSAPKVDIAKSTAPVSSSASTLIQSKNTVPATTTATPSQTPSVTSQEISDNQPPSSSTSQSSQQASNDKNSNEVISNTNEQQEPEEEIEVITIDDSDSDVDETNPTATKSIDNQNRSTAETGASSGQYSSNSDLCQPFELYNILAHSGEHATPPQVYMDQNSMMGQLSSVTQQQQLHQQPVPNDVIDISD